MNDYKKKCYLARANLTYYKNLNKKYRKDISFMKYNIRLLEKKIERLKRYDKEKSYLIIELLKEKNND